MPRERVLYPSQADMTAELRDLMASRDVLIEAATGGGKSTMMLVAAAGALRDGRATHVLIAAPQTAIEDGFIPTDEIEYRSPEGCPAVDVTVGPAETGGGGRHWLFRTPCPIGCFQNAFGLPGLDVRGVGGQVAVEPSVHPYYGSPYLWMIHPREGIAPIPQWLLARLMGWTTDRTPEVAPEISDGAAASPRPAGDRPGDLDLLTDDAIRRFPCTGPGTRGGEFARLVPSLVGRGFDDATVVTVAVAWWGYHHDRGLCRTGPANAAEEARRYVARLRESDRFVPATRADGHREQCRSIRLPEGWREEMDRETRAGREQDARTIKNNTDLTLIRRRLSDRLCDSADEWAFVEALTVQVIHHRSGQGVGPVRFTADQLRQIAGDREEGRAWDDQQFDRLKAKFIDRPDRPASRYALLRQVRAGNRATATRPARPSEFEVTGLSGFLRGLV